MADLICPIDRGPLEQHGDNLHCTRCGQNFPIVNGTPILINEANSVFRIADYTNGQAYEGASGYSGAADRTSGLRRLYRAFGRRLSEAPVPGAPFDPLQVIREHIPNARILVIGSGERRRDGDVTYTDVAFAPNIVCICDGHDLPFSEGAFDAVFVEAVLEHVCDPARVVQEITRVLSPSGLVYAVTPFLQPVHMGAYDFTRFTFLGHRRLFRQYDDLHSGMCGGPAYSAIHLFRNLMLSMSDHPRVRSILRLGALLVTYPMRYLDRFTSRTQSSYNAACAFYFLGRKRETPIPDREIIGMFRGA